MMGIMVCLHFSERETRIKSGIVKKETLKTPLIRRLYGFLNGI